LRSISLVRGLVTVMRTDVADPSSSIARLSSVLRRLASLPVCQLHLSGDAPEEAASPAIDPQLHDEQCLVVSRLECALTVLGSITEPSGGKANATVGGVTSPGGGNDGDLRDRCQRVDAAPQHCSGRSLRSANHSPRENFCQA
jgi:hypothetical protein